MRAVVSSIVTPVVTSVVRGSGAGPTPPVTYATWSPLDKSPEIGLSDGDLHTTGNDVWPSARATIAILTGEKKYFEVQSLSTSATRVVGIATSSASLELGFFVGADDQGFGMYAGLQWYRTNIGTYLANTESWALGKVVRVLVDRVNNEITWYMGNTLLDTVSISALGNGPLYPMISETIGGQSLTNFGASDWAYAIPDGYTGVSS